MNVSTFELFKPGVGPSGSHTSMGPMTAALRFVRGLNNRVAARATRLGSRWCHFLALTGRGHGTDRRQLGSRVCRVNVDPDVADIAFEAIGATGKLPLGGGRPIAFDATEDIVWLGRERLPGPSQRSGHHRFDSAHC